MGVGVGFIAGGLPQRARKGLYAGRKIMVGNTITDKSNQKSVRGCYAGGYAEEGAVS
jgi:hypothetical protein